MLQQEATRSGGAVLASFWRLAGMPADSGTPTGWLLTTSHRLVTIHCACDPELAAPRFLQRRRHSGHLDAESSYQDVLSSLREPTRLLPLDISQRIDVDTSHAPDVDDVVRRSADRSRANFSNL